MCRWYKEEGEGAGRRRGRAKTLLRRRSERWMGAVGGEGVGRGSGEGKRAGEAVAAEEAEAEAASRDGGRGVAAVAEEKVKVENSEGAAVG